MDTNENPWISASSNGACVEMRRAADGCVEVRDSKGDDSMILTFTREEFSAWLDGAKRGEFDHLA